MRGHHQLGIWGNKQLQMCVCGDWGGGGGTKYGGYGMLHCYNYTLQVQRENLLAREALFESELKAYNDNENTEVRRSNSATSTTGKR
jgi:hypothetical protein